MRDVPSAGRDLVALGDVGYRLSHWCLRRPGRGDVMTRWVVVPDGKLWGVVVVREDGSRESMRARWQGLSCIDARCLAADLNDAYRRAQLEAWEGMRREIFA